MNARLTYGFVFSAAFLFAAAACDSSPSLKQDDSRHPAADNTKKNERDQSPAAVTPGDQKENPTDLAITQKIRQGVVKADDISMTGKNVKIITQNGVVTLRGPVGTAKERDQIVALATSTPDVTRVDNQLEVKTQ